MTESQSAAEAHPELLFPWVKPYYRRPLSLVRGAGVRVWDAEGREYLDFFSGILTTSVGHCHPEVSARVVEQVERLGHTSTLYVTENQVRLAERLTALAPGGLGRACFTNSGTEAVEAGVMAARIHTGRHEVVCLRLAYSGRSHLAAGMTGHAPWRQLPAAAGGLVHARSPYTYRSPLGPDAPVEAQVDFFIDDLVETIETTTSGGPAALFAETIQGVGGFIVPPAGYFQRAAEVIRSYGGLLIIDEIQTGFGRTGGRWFGIEHWEVEPDILCLAKGIANGYPVGATLAREEVAASWTGPSISTFGGNPVCAAAALATLDVMEREDTPARSAARGAQVRERLEALAERHAWIGEARGMGLMQALEIVRPAEGSGASAAPGPGAPDPDRARAVLEAARDEGLLVGVGGLHGHVVRTGPSMLITEEETAEALDRLERACERAAGA